MIRVTIHLPAAMGDVLDVLRCIAEHWPDATLDVHGPHGWTIDLPALADGTPVQIAEATG